MPLHFEGKDAVQHLKKARLKGLIAASEIHGVETPGSISAGIDALHDTILVLLILWAIFPFLPLQTHLPLLITLGFSFCIWKTGRSTLLGWRRLNRLHKLIEEEKWEIEHHRGSEKEELTELYRAKGFEGKLLAEVIDVLMADEDRLLKVMLEEELGLTLETYEHPLKQGFGAFLGSLSGFIVLLIGFFLNPTFAIPLFGAFLLIATTLILSKKEIKSFLPPLTWTCAVILFAVLGARFIAQVVFK